MRKGLLLYNPAAGRMPVRPFVRGILRPLRAANSYRMKKGRSGAERPFLVSFTRRLPHAAFDLLRIIAHCRHRNIRGAAVDSGY